VNGIEITGVAFGADKKASAAKIGKGREDRKEDQTL
jgi:hypothetical protein